MSDFQELVKSFPKIREYVRDFFVYGFKTRQDFTEKSPRTYDNQRRRLESWLMPFIRRDYVPEGSNISLAIDSNLLDTNPLFQVWKTRSFTDNDIVLHFLILDLLGQGGALTAEEITDGLLTSYEALFDVQIVRRKCNAYTKEGLLEKRTSRKKVVYRLDTTLARWIQGQEEILDALDFYQMAGCFGIVGNVLAQQMDHQNHTFRVKHSFFVHTLEDEILLVLLEAMNRKSLVELTLKSPGRDRPATAVCVPLQIFASTRSGRRFLCGYVTKSRRFTCFRLDSVKSVVISETAEDYDGLLSSLLKNRRYLWGVSFQNEEGHHLDTLVMTLKIQEPEEDFIVERLVREGRGGIVLRKAPGIWVYEIQVFDCQELLPWIRTFTGRILSLSCSAKSVEECFYRDLSTMYHKYRLDRTSQQ